VKIAIAGAPVGIVPGLLEIIYNPGTCIVYYVSAGARELHLFWPLRGFERLDRGVEISGYRLRKKLGIPTEINLFDYFMGGSEGKKVGARKG